MDAMTGAQAGSDQGSKATGPRILVVDDNDDNRYTLTLYLDLEGYANVETAHDGEPTHRTFAVHPDTGVKIEGAILPRFQEALALAARSVLAFPHIAFSGLDIAMSPAGPVVIATNVETAQDG